MEYIYRGMVFLKAPEFVDLGGFVCMRSTLTKVGGASLTPISGRLCSSDIVMFLCVTGLCYVVDYVRA